MTINLTIPTAKGHLPVGTVFTHKDGKEYRVVGRRGLFAVCALTTPEPTEREQILAEERDIWQYYAGERKVQIQRLTAELAALRATIPPPSWWVRFWRGGK